ncbi:hypothetical protein Tco_1182827 [Tanacetum coccineum]
MWNVTRISYGESWKARMQGGSVEEGLCGDFVAMAYFRQQREDVVHLVSRINRRLIHGVLDSKLSPVFGCHLQNCSPMKAQPASLTQTSYMNLWMEKEGLSWNMCNVHQRASSDDIIESSITIQHCSFSIIPLDLYGTVCIFERRRINASTQVLLDREEPYTYFG